MSTKIIPIPMPIAHAFLLVGERTVLVDSGNPGNEKRILKTLQKHNFEARDLSLILLTHGHWDHLGSAEAIRSLSKAPIALHHADLELAAAGQDKLKAYGFGSSLFEPFFSSRRFKPLEPDVILNGTESLASYGVNAKLLETPGHTKGSISVLLENGDAIVGDVLRGDFVFENRPNWHFFYDDPIMVRSSVKTLLDLKLHKLFVGHGKPFSFKSLQQRFRRQVAA
jgi:hydroxyacylglutathione hydrolase